MISTRLYWIDGPWPGKLAMAARPRGGDWLDSEMAGWRRANVDTVFSLLTPAEEADLGLEAEEETAKSHGLRFLRFSIPDRQVPDSEVAFSRALEELEAELEADRNVVLHCRQGLGRTGIAAACLLITKGATPEAALRQLSMIRGVTLPETSEQRQWIDRYAVLAAISGYLE